MKRTAIVHLATELEQLINRYRFEYDITYEEVVGVLMMKAHTMIDEAIDVTMEEAEEDES